MNWTRTPPTEPGFYWCRNRDNLKIAEIAEGMTSPALVAWFPSGWGEILLTDPHLATAEWAGPLQSPA